MKTPLEVLFTPADFGQLKDRDLGDTTCVVFDVLRATSSIVTALASGAEAVLPVSSISEALEIRAQRSDVLLAGERDGVRIPASLTGGVAFDLGNSPREFSSERVRGNTLVMTTTNGTRALRACARAQCVLVAAFLNLSATADFLRRAKPPQLLLVCSGTGEEAAYEDILGAGALCDLLSSEYGDGEIADAALVARRLFQLEPDLLTAVKRSRNARRLLSRPELRDDVAYCCQRDVIPSSAVLSGDGRVQLGTTPG